MVSFNLFDLLTWPLILLGLIRGSYYTYKCLKEDSNKDRKEEQLQYWVVFSAIIFFFPWFDRILGWFLFAGLIGIAKFILLIMVVVTRSNYRFIYVLIEQNFLSLVEPWVKKALILTEDFRSQFCDFTLICLTSGHQWLIQLLINEMSNEKVQTLKKTLNNSINIVKREEVAREKQDRGYNNKDSNISSTQINNTTDSTRIKETNEQLKTVFEHAAADHQSSPGNTIRQRNSGNTSSQ